MSYKKNVVYLNDEELEKVTGGISESDAKDDANIGRECTVLKEVGDDGGNLVSKSGIYKGGYRNGFADVQVAGDNFVTRFSIENIIF